MRPPPSLPRWVLLANRPFSPCPRAAGTWVCPQSSWRVAREGAGRPGDNKGGPGGSGEGAPLRETEPFLSFPPWWGGANNGTEQAGTSPAPTANAAAFRFQSLAGFTHPFRLVLCRAVFSPTEFSGTGSPTRVP